MVTNTKTRQFDYGNDFLHQYGGEWFDNKLDAELGRVYVLTGGRGSGKTLTMTALACSALQRGHKVWSNYPIHFMHHYRYIGRRLLTSIPLDMKALYTFDKSLISGYVCIDEINLWASARRSMSVANRLINSTMQLIRKRKLSFMFTCQNFQWLDAQLRFQTDVLIKCRDQYFYRPHQLKRGQFISLLMYDMSGLLTGTPYSEEPTNKNKVQVNFWGQPFWNCYDSWEEFDVMEASRSVKLVNDTNIIDVRDGAPVYDDGWDKLGREAKVREVLAHLKIGAGVKFTTQEMSEFIQASGVKLGVKERGLILKKAGWKYKQTREGNFYVSEPDVSDDR